MDSELKVQHPCWSWTASPSLTKACTHYLGVYISVVSILAVNKRRFGKGDSLLPASALNDGGDLLLHTFYFTYTQCTVCTIVRACPDSIQRTGNFTRKSIFTHRCLETTLSVYTVFKRLYLWNCTSYEAGFRLILEVISRTSTRINK